MTPQTENLSNPRSIPELGSESNNGDTPVSASSLASIRKQRRRRSKLWLVVGVVCVLGCVAGAAWMLIPGADANAQLVWREAKKQDIQLTIMERGELQSANNVDVICQVKIGRGERGPTIRWLIAPGTYVQQGEDIMKLEDSAFWKELLDQEIVLQKAKNEYQQSEDQLKIVRSQNKANLEVAELEIKKKEKELEKYALGDSGKLEKDSESQKSLAKSEVERWLQKVAFARQMVTKRSFSQAQLDETMDSLRSAQEKLAAAERHHEVLTQFDYDLQILTFKSAVAQAKSEKERIKATALAEDSKAVNDRDTKKLVMNQEQNKYDEIKAEIEKCNIKAPESGLCVYYVSERSRRSSESEKIEIGASVSEGQKLMQIPDLSHMLVVTRVHEALISHVKGEQFERTGFTEAMKVATMLPADSTSRLFSGIGYPALRKQRSARWLKEYAKKKIYDGQRAEVIVDASAGKTLRAKVKKVATVATKQWFSDVSTYEVTVEILDPVERLKPGMNARVKIFTDRRADNVLAIPVQSVFRNVDKTGVTHFVYVRTPEGPEKRPVTVGINNEKLVEIKSGLKEGEFVAENPMTVHNNATGEIAMPDSKGGEKGKPGAGGAAPGGGRPGAGGRPGGSGGRAGGGGGAARRPAK